MDRLSQSAACESIIDFSDWKRGKMREDLKELDLCAQDDLFLRSMLYERAIIRWGRGSSAAEILSWLDRATGYPFAHLTNARDILRKSLNLPPQALSSRGQNPFYGRRG
jgi:hypothetical protein